jgi:hypothetical protein
LTASKKFGRIATQEREKRMFEIGDKVTIKTCNPPKGGEIILWHYDEGNVWTVELSDGSQEDFGDHELAPATDAYGHPWRVSK